MGFLSTACVLYVCVCSMCACVIRVIAEREIQLCLSPHPWLPTHVCTAARLQVCMELDRMHEEVHHVKPSKRAKRALRRDGRPAALFCAGL